METPVHIENKRKEAFAPKKTENHGLRMKYLRMVSEALIPAMYIIFTICFIFYGNSFY